MGSGLSTSHRNRSTLHQPPAAPPAWVVGADGSLSEFLPPFCVSDVLAGNNADQELFVCSSDALYFDAAVPALGAGEPLRPGQIYFVLPAAMLGRPLSAADMAALAVRASEAIAARATRPAKARVAPVRVDGDGEVNEKLNQRTLGDNVALLNSVRNDRKLTVMARPPIRRALSDIAEDA